MNCGKWCALRRAAAWLVLAMFVCGLGWRARPASAATNVAVFNFQMKSDTPDWKWLEKGLSDRIATDFVQDRALTVVARDEMQMVAETLHWVPELAMVDPIVTMTVKTELRAETLVTGVYSVEGEEIRITGQIVDVAGRSELARKEIAGKATDVLELQRRLSADLLAWFSKKPPAEILATLPVWTRSLPAARALYEGMDFYDQGRYAEGWLKFRQASRTDPAYMEAQYWVGKMYYFMDRYEHARRALEKFVYLDMAHPRVGDAMVEYVHTYEISDAPAESLLQLYEDLGKRYPDALVWEGRGWGERGFLASVDWFKYKSVQLLGQLGRHKEVALITRPALGEAGGFFSRLAGTKKCYCILNVLDHHARTGETFEPDVLIDTKWERERRQVLQFDKKGTAIEWQFPSPTRIQGSASGTADKTAPFDREKEDTVLLLVAPEGHVFTSLSFYALADGDDAAMEVALFVLGMGTPIVAGCPQFAPQRTETVAAARERGIVWDNVPSSGLLQARCVFRAKDMFSQPVAVRGVRVVPRLAAMPAPGAIDVSCVDTPNFRVEVDGLFARWLPGIVGPLAPGEHAVRLAPLEPGVPYEPWETRVTVESGKVTRLPGRLPWKSGSPWSSWKTVCIGKDYPGYDLRLRNPADAPAIQTDEGAIRLVWTYRGDLWSSVSTDGENFSAPAKLDLPVSSGWSEEKPRLLRDESGRFILTFLSDREARHRYLPYLSWSRDFIHWTAPALVSGKTVTEYDVLQDDRGRFIWAQMFEQTISILSSRDGFHWQPLGSVDVAEQGWRADLVRMIQREDGAFELFVTEQGSGGSIPAIRNRDVGGRVLCRVSSDGSTWSKPEIIAQCHWDANPTGFACGRANGHTFVLWSRCDPAYLHSRLALYARKSEGRWHQAGCTPSLPPGEKISAAFHPAWGYLIASMAPDDAAGYFAYQYRGPYLMRGPSLDPLRGGAPDTRLAREDPSLPSQDKIGRGFTRDAAGRVLNVSLRNKAVEEWFRTFEPRPAPGNGPGDLASLPFVWSMPNRVPCGSAWFEVKDRAAFKGPAPQSGTVSPKAVVLNLQRGALKMALALDSKTPESPSYDVLRLDAAGQGKFENAAEIPWLFMSFDPAPEKAFKYTFIHPAVSLKDGNRIVQAAMKARFEEGRGQQTFQMNLFTCSLGKCAFGMKIHDVLLIDADGNLRINNAFRITSLEGQKHVFGSGDTVVVDPPKTKPAKPFGGTSDERRVTWGYYGHPLLVDGALYEVTVSEDGARISAKPFQGKTGLIRIDHPLWEAEIANEGRVIVLHGGTAAVPVPIGRYRVLRYWEWSPDGGQWADVQPLCLWRPESSVGKEFWIEVREGQTLEVPAGSPLRGQLVVEQDGRTLRFRVRIADTGGWQEVDTQDPHQECSIIIRDASGQPVKTLRSTLIHSRAEWSVPPELRGTFSASVEVGPGRFPVTVEKSQFSVK